MLQYNPDTFSLSLMGMMQPGAGTGCRVDIIGRTGSGGNVRTGAPTMTGRHGTVTRSFSFYSAAIQTYVVALKMSIGNASAIA
jgi:hypothetical protein